VVWETDANNFPATTKQEISLSHSSCCAGHNHHHLSCSFHIRLGPVHIQGIDRMSTTSHSFLTSGVSNQLKLMNFHHQSLKGSLQRFFLGVSCPISLFPLHQRTDPDSDTQSKVASCACKIDRKESEKLSQLQRTGLARTLDRMASAEDNPHRFVTGGDEVTSNSSASPGVRWVDIPVRLI
jgi:hypothetical protein